MTITSPFRDIAIQGRIVIAGPCSAESERQVLDAARGVASAGAAIFRAGVWKPRTKPGTFEGIGTPALKWLVKARAETGLPVATEVATREHVEEALAAGIDMLWVGARTTTSPFAMDEVAKAILDSGRAATTAVLVKNPVNPDIELWIGAMERLHAAGVTRLAAVHRGFSAYNAAPYRNDPMWHIPLELRRRFPTLDIICDPSHIGGSRRLIAPLSQRAIDMGFDGLIIESHCNPDEALSDAAQQIIPSALAEILASLTDRNQSCTTEGLEAMRAEIDHIDNELMALLAQRMKVVRDIGEYKRSRSIPVVQPERFDRLLTRHMSEAETLGLRPEFIKNLLTVIHAESVNRQIDRPSPQ